MAEALGSRQTFPPLFSVALKQRTGLLSSYKSASLSEQTPEDGEERIGKDQGFPNDKKNKELGTYITSTLAQWTPGLNTFTKEILFSGIPEIVFVH